MAIPARPSVEVVEVRSLPLIAVVLVACVPPANDQRALSADGYEFIVVGSGAGGGPLAARLARAGRSVLLLEAGADVGGKLEYQVPAMHALSTEDPEMAWWFFVRHHAEAGLDEQDSKHTPEGILYPRGSALGGSAAVNAMVTVLPSPWDWNRIAALTDDASWRAAAMAQHYDQVRQWLGVEVPDADLAMHDRKVSGYLAAAASAHAGEPVGEGAELLRVLSQDVNASLSHGETTGLFRLPLATKDGRRSSPRELILETAAAGFPLTIRTGAFVTRVLFDDARPPQAIGVEYASGDRIYGASLGTRGAPGERHVEHATEEVILSAGTFNSPQLLMLSGVGDPEVLEPLGIPVVAARPGVGENLQDRYEAPVVTEFTTPVSVVEDCELGALVEPKRDPCLDEWQQGEGVYRTSGFLASVLRRSGPEEPYANLQIFAVPGDARGYFPGYSADSLARKTRFTWLILQAHTDNSDGYVRLQSADPFQTPDINFNYFDEAAPAADPDLQAMVEGVRFVRRIVEEMNRTHPNDPPREIWPGHELDSDEEIAAFVRRETWGHHACCTSKMGRPDDETAVVDARFRVIGTRGLRVVDASVFPKIPGTFVALPTYMISEKAAEAILEDNP